MSHWMNKALLLAATVVLFALPASALAGTCGVLPFSAGPGVNRGAAPNITALVSSELDIRGGYDLVIAADPEDFEGGDCGASSSCIKSFGQANKHEAVLAGTVASAGDDSYTLTLKLHDGNNASLIRTVQREVPSKADQLMDAVADVIIELVTGEAPAEEEEEDAAASGPLYDDLDFDDLMEDSDEELDEPKRKRGRAAPRNPDRDRDRDYDEDEEDDPFALDDELDSLDLSAEEMEKKKRDRERQAQLEREREAEKERLARERAAEERRRRIAEEREREEEERLRAERAERDRRARIERERREAEEREQMERERREREEEERQARADRERREREAEERAERDRIRQEREDEERRQARAERDRRDREDQERQAREEREERERRAERDREQERERSRERDRNRDRDEDYARDDRDDAMADRVARERERRRNEELDRAERDRDDVDLDDAVALAPATGILIGSAFDDDDGGFTIGPADDDEDDDGGILIGSAADEISFGDDDDDDDEPREGMIISEAEEDENPGVRRRREAESGDDRYARARNFNSPSDDREDDDRDYDRSDDRVDDRDDEEDDYDRDDDYRRSSARSRTASRSSSRDRDYDSSERVASRDDSYLSDDYDEYDLDAESYGTTRRSKPRSKVSESSTRSGNRPWFSGRVTGGYTNYYLHFAQYGLDIGVFPSPRVSVDVQVDFWTLSIRECPECEQEYRTLPSFYLGGSYRFTNLKIVQPYVGGDVGAVVYAIGTLDDGTGAISRRPLMGVAFEVKGGVDFMFTRHFGLGAGLKAGLAYASKIKENVHPDWNPLQFLLNARIAAVVQF